ncbi:response regulator [Rasiella rasia]|uniref:histidine kinase n=1 Tax=Rasiella rasia TaxID=2744027 RepID=A0A6G6GP97_9FLAO|nr:response regulator [Rasiella rasia]QIE60304.1 response regulator [Rasiella rasia]
MATISAEDSITLATYRVKLSQYVNPIPDSAFYYGRKIKALATSLNYGKGIADADYLLGACFKRVQENDSAINSFKKSLRLSEILAYDIGKGRAYNSLGRTYYLLGKMDSSIVASKNAIASIKEENTTAKTIIADSHTALAIAYSRKNDMNKAITQLLKVDSMHHKTPLRPDVIAAAYQNLGNIYLELEEYPSAIEQFDKANDQFAKLPEGASQFYKNTTNVFLGNAYLQTEKIELADSLLSNSYNYFKKTEDHRLVAEITNYLGQVELKKNNPVKAEAYFIESFTVHRDNDRPYEAALGALEIAKLELSKNRPDIALNYIKEANVLNLDADNSKLQQELLFYAGQAYNQKGNYKEAYKLSNLAKKLQDSLQQVQSAEKIKEIEAIYETETKDREIALLTSQNELALQQKANQRNLMLAGLGVTTVIGLFFFFQYQNRKKTNKKLQELDKAKSTFFANISHEFRTPLALIKGPIEDQLEESALKGSHRRNLLAAQRNTERLEGLVEQLLALSKLESGAMKIQVQPTAINSFLKAQTESFQYLASEKNNTYIIDLNTSDQICWLDQDIFEKACVNLLGNAFKYSPDKATIRVTCSIANDYLHFTVQNSGISISAKEQEHIFTRFYQTQNSNSGSGIGLALTKELMQLHKGNISVDSSELDGVTFKVTFPISEETYSPEEKLDPQLYTDTIVTTAEPQLILETKSISPDDAPMLLLIDDSKEIRDYVTSIFETTYIVITATNGKEGFEAAQKHIPDVIISDVMMPIEDGFELTKHCKENTLTSHIPILLLTAKNNITDQLEGLGIGADAYLTKPFSSKLLKARVKNLLENRRKLQERFSQELILTPKEIAITSADEQFLERLQEVLDTKLTNSEFSASIFCEEMGVSRMQLHRKLKALTGYATTEFIRSQRLKLAKQLIEQDKISISEVGYTVGFNDHSYFSKCFKQEFGHSPTEFLKNS